MHMALDEQHVLLRVQTAGDILRQLLHRHAGRAGKTHDVLIFQPDNVRVNFAVAGLQIGNFAVVLCTLRFEFVDLRIHNFPPDTIISLKSLILMKSFEACKSRASHG